MENTVHNQIASFIWGIADDCLRDIYARGKYRDVILPMTVIRRLDAVLESTKADVLAMKQRLDDAGVANQTGALCKAAKQAFCNASPFCLRDLTSRAKEQQLKADFLAYLDGFSPNVQEVLEKFQFRRQVDTMSESGILGHVIEKFVSPTINLSQEAILDDKGNEILPGLDNHSMGTIFEELIRRFNEENNEEAGEHFTPRDVVELMADLVFQPVADKLLDATYSIYDGASGTGGMLTVSENRLNQLAKKQGKKASILLHGQETAPETYAIAKAEMLIKGDGKQADNIKFGSTLSADQFPTRQFDFMLSNPPYGKSWKIDQEKMGGKKEILDSHFVQSYKGNPQFQMVPRSSDGQLLFLLNNVSKMKETALGSRIAEVHNGSSLFTGDAGQGESNARRYLLENDLVEAIIALPEKLFYNTGIATYIWVCSNRKAANRKGKIQLIDATSFKEPLRKNLGEKNCIISRPLRQKILNIYNAFEEGEYSKIFANEEFGYWKVTIHQPKLCTNGIPQKDKKGKLLPDKDLTDTERVPLTYPGGLDAWFAKEILPRTPHAWIDRKKTAIGYELSFKRYFYKIEVIDTLDDISEELKILEQASIKWTAQILNLLKKRKENSVKKIDTKEFWLPTIPEHWGMRKIKHIFRERNETGHPKEKLLVASQDKGVVSKKEYGLRTVEATKNLHLLKLVNVGDFVISLRSFQGGIEYAWTRGIISPAYTVLIPDIHNPHYLRYLLNVICLKSF